MQTKRAVRMRWQTNPTGSGQHISEGPAIDKIHEGDRVALYKNIIVLQDQFSFKNQLTAETNINKEFTQINKIKHLRGLNSPPKDARVLSTRGNNKIRKTDASLGRWNRQRWLSSYQNHRQCF